MSKTRAPYPLEFRQQMVELLRAGHTPASVQPMYSRTLASSARGLTGFEK